MVRWWGATEESWWEVCTIRLTSFRKVALVALGGGDRREAKWTQGNHRPATRSSKASLAVRWGGGFRRVSSQKSVANRGGKSVRRSRTR